MKTTSTFQLVFILALLLAVSAFATPPDQIATFSIVGHDSTTGELGVAVASRFFAVGAVVPWAKADIGAVATQAYANTTFGWRGLTLLREGLTPDSAIAVLTAEDEGADRRQVGIVDAQGRAATYTGDGCTAWAGGRSGPGYAIQGNILAGETVVTAMEKAWLETEGSLAERLYATLLAGEAEGGDSRGKQSAAMYVVRAEAGYGGYTDQAIDIRVDDHPEPFKELGRLLDIAQVNYLWNDAWTLFTRKQYAQALPLMEKAGQLDPDYPELIYDVAVIRLANGDETGALEALSRAIELNPSLAASAKQDSDLEALWGTDDFKALVP